MADNNEAAKNKALHLLSGRDYSKNELYIKLSGIYGEKAAASAVKLMCEHGYIDDGRYAAKLAKRYVSAKKYGKSRAALMMKQKGLDAVTINNALAAYSDDDVISDIAELMRTKYAEKLFAETDDPVEAKKEVQKVIASLARRGYGYSDIKSALETVREEAEEEED